MVVGKTEMMMRTNRLEQPQRQLLLQAQRHPIHQGKKVGVTSSFVSASGPKRRTKPIADEIRKTPEEVVAERHRTKGVQRTMKGYGTKSKEQKDVIDGHVADFLYENCLPLNIVISRSWEILLESIGHMDLVI
jgi:RNase H-fold protein (predicted Holliday junction resolvase)